MIRAAFAFLMLLLMTSPDCGAAPNVLVIVADDLGYEVPGCYGGKDFQTPNIDRLASQGLRLTNAYASAVCTPSRMSYYTGRYVVNHGFRSVLPVHTGSPKAVDFSKLPTLPGALRRVAEPKQMLKASSKIAPDFNPGTGKEKNVPPVGRPESSRITLAFAASLQDATELRFTNPD